MQRLHEESFTLLQHSPTWNSTLEKDEEDLAEMDMRRRLPRLGTRDVAEFPGLPDKWDVELTPDSVFTFRYCTKLVQPRRP